MKMIMRMSGNKQWILMPLTYRMQNRHLFYLRKDSNALKPETNIHVKINKQIIFH